MCIYVWSWKITLSERNFSTWLLVKYSHVVVAQKIPNVIAHHVFIVLTFVAFFEWPNVLVEPLAVFFRVVPHVALEMIEGHTATHPAVRIHKVLLQFSVIVNFVVSQEATHDSHETCPCFLLNSCQLRREGFGVN